jgi:hypothetical protein
MTKVKTDTNSGRSNIYVMWHSSLCEGLWKDNAMTKVKTDRNSGRSDICHGTFIALWRVIKRQYNDQSKDIQK